VHWTDGYYGELYLDSVEDLLTPALSALEAEVIARLLELVPGHRVLDLACGHGRHARVLAGRVGELWAIDRSGPYLARAATSGPPNPALRLVQADLRALPFPPDTFDGIYSWYGSLFMFDDEENAAALAELARVLRPGGRALVHHGNPLRLAREPCERSRRLLADGTVVEEDAVFDPATGLDRAERRMLRPGGSVLAGTSILRYYRPAEWGPLARRAGLRIVELTSTTGAMPSPDHRERAGAADPSAGPGPDAPDLVALLERT
jgi:SAM-dependent methyltransferase